MHKRNGRKIERIKCRSPFLVVTVAMVETRQANIVRTGCLPTLRTKISSSMIWDTPYAMKNAFLPPLMTTL
jgi:hypothetical protein